jgi:HEAT repeat protein
MNERPTAPATPELAALLAAMRDPDPFIRADALDRTGPADGAIHTVEAALADDYPLVRRGAVRALARIGGTQAARALLRASAHDLSAEVREEAVSALASLLRAGATAAPA